jgi:hypothetical protein
MRTRRDGTAGTVGAAAKQRVRYLKRQATAPCSAGGRVLLPHCRPVRSVILSMEVDGMFNGEPDTMIRLCAPPDGYRQLPWPEVTAAVLGVSASCWWSLQRCYTTSVHRVC